MSQSLLLNSRSEKNDKNSIECPRTYSFKQQESHQTRDELESYEIGEDKMKQSSSEHVNETDGSFVLQPWSDAVGSSTTSECEIQKPHLNPCTGDHPNSQTISVPTQNLLSRVSMFELLSITFFNFPYGFICGTFGLWLLPAEANRLFPDTQSLTLGLSLGVVGLTQLACPLAGKISDLHVSNSQFGKRRPYIVGGSVFAVAATIGMYISSRALFGYFYYVCLFFGMTGLNVVYAVQCGLVPDVLDKEIQGRSSGLVAVHTLLGSGSGFALIIGTSEFDFHFVYFLYIGLVTLSCCLVCGTARRLEVRKNLNLQFRNLTRQTSMEYSFRETPSTFNSDSRKNMQTSTATSPPSHESTRLLMPRSTTSDDVVDGTLELTESNKPTQPDVNKHGDSMIEIGGMRKDDQLPKIHDARELYSRSSIKLQRQFEDPARIHQVKKMRSEILQSKANFAQVITAYTIDTSKGLDFFWVFVGRALYYIGVSVQAFLSYYLRDVIGTPTEAQRRMQIGCIALVAQATAALVAYPTGSYTDKHQEVGKKPLIFLACGIMAAVYLGFLFAPMFNHYAFHFLMFIAIIYGAGNGCFLAVDYALALATLPDKENTTHALGIWGVSAFIGSALGPMLWGALIEGFGKDSNTQHYNFAGYIAIMIGGVISTLIAGGTIALIKDVA